MSTTAAQINAALSKRYSSDDWKIWFEVSDSTGAAASRRADAVAMNIWPSKGFQVHAFEVKVSRNDFKKELEDLTKWQAVGRFADFFWLASPCGLVSPDEIPAQWGLIELTKGGLRIKKQAPALEAAPLDRGFVASLLRSGRDLTREEIEGKAQELAQSRIADVREQERVRYDNLLAREKARSDKLSQWIDGFQRKYGVRPQTHCNPEIMAKRLEVAARLDQGAVLTAASAARSFADLVDDLRDLEKESQALGRSAFTEADR